MAKPNILNKNEAAKIAGVDPKTIYEWVNKGYLRKRWVKGRKTFKIDQYELEEYIKNRDMIKIYNGNIGIETTDYFVKKELLGDK